ncbi:MAG TPA: hypothetical protein VGQ83_26695 [Polyangia bacterium]|jgi:hypothetical protein
MREPRIRRKPVKVSRLEMEAILDALPEWSPGGRLQPFAVRGRIEATWLSGFGAETLDVMRADDLDADGRHLRLHIGNDVARFGAPRVRLTPRLRRVLLAVRARGDALLFGRRRTLSHPWLDDAAVRVLDPARALAFSPWDLRRAWLDQVRQGHADFLRPALVSASEAAVLLGRSHCFVDYHTAWTFELTPTTSYRNGAPLYAVDRLLEWGRERRLTA